MDSTNNNLQNLGSPYAEQLANGFGNLRFKGLIEKEFLESFVDQNLFRGRVTGILALGMILALTLTDFLLGAMPGTEVLNALRLYVLCPLVSIIVAATFHPDLKRHYIPIAATSATLVGLVVIYMSVTAALAGASYVLGSLVLIVLAGCLFLGLLFHVAIAVSTLLVLAFSTMGLFMGLPFNQLLYSTVILATAAVIGLLSAYNLEHASRENWRAAHTRDCRLTKRR